MNQPQDEKFLGVILAAGIGSRLRPMTNNRPKCMIRTAGVPLLEYQINAYRQAGIDELVIVVGYEGHEVRDYCRRIKNMKIRIVANEDYETTNNMYSLYLARAHIGNRPFILNNADLAIDPSVVRTILESPHPSGVAIDSSIYMQESMKVVAGEDGYLNDISKKIPESLSSGCSIDFYKFSKADAKTFLEEVRSIIEDEGNFRDWTEVALQRAFKKKSLRFAPIDIVGHAWFEVDNYEDLALSDRIFSHFDRDIESFKAVFLDLDGTLYVGKTPIKGAASAVSHLRAQGKKIFFLTNNSSKDKADCVALLRGMDIDANTGDVISSPDAMIRFLKERHVHALHILGTKNLKKTFTENGFDTDSPDPEYVVVGYDTELDYAKLVAASRFINQGIRILATHSDRFCPSEDGPIPDIGAILALLKTALNAEPEIIFGKPRRQMVDHIMADHGLIPREVLFVGDRLHTDIMMAHNMGAKSLLVLTGETTRDQLQDSTTQPDYILKSLGDIVPET